MAPVGGAAAAPAPSPAAGVVTDHGGRASRTVAAEAPFAPPHPAPSPPPTDYDPMRTGERIELPMTGPSRRTLVGMFLGVGLGCAALGAVVAARTFRSPAAEPVTTVGLIGEPSAVSPDDGGAPPATAETPPTRGAPAAPARPSAPRVGNGPARPAPEAPAVAARPPSAPSAPSAPNAPATPTAPSAPTTPTAPSAPPSPVAAAPSTPAAPTAPEAPTPGEDGLVERGPRTSQGGYRLGEETDATGRMDPAAFTYVYRHYAPQISACYSSASRNREVNGVVVMRVRIGEDGRVRRTRVVSDTARVPELVECLHNSVRSWRYPQPEGGEVEVDYPMRFGSAR